MGKEGLRRLNSDFNTKFISEAGTWKTNRDYFAFVELDGFACWVVAESYDNDDENLSAKLAVETVLNLFEKKPSISKRKLRSYVRAAHEQLTSQSKRFSLKASIIVVATNYKYVRYAYCGNCKLHIFRGSAVAHKSKDHSLYQRMVDDGDIPDDEEFTSETKNVLHYLGKHGGLNIDTSKKLTLYDEDIMLISTWGFWNKLNTIEMLDALEESQDPETYLDELQDLYLSKQEGTVDNHTLAAVFVHQVFNEKKNRKKLIIALIIVGVVLLTVAIVAWVLIHRANVNRRELINSIMERQQIGDTHLQNNNLPRALSEFENAIENSRTLRTTGRHGETNTEIRDNLVLRQLVTISILDAEGLFNQGRYEEARNTLMVALEEINYNIDILYFLNRDSLQERISLAYDNDFITELTALGDFQADLGQFALALNNYYQARNIAQANGDLNRQRELTLLIESMRTQMLLRENEILENLQNLEQQELEELLQTTEQLVLEATQLASQGYFERSIEFFQTAQNSFISLGEFSRAMELEQNILESRELIENRTEEERAAIAGSHMAMGENYMLQNNFTSAISNFQTARDMFTLINRTNSVTLVNERLSLANARQTENTMANRIIEINQIEAEGDALLIQSDYLGARERFVQAQILFRGINQLDRVLILDEKIRGTIDLERLLATPEGDEEEVETNNNNELENEAAGTNNSMLEDIFETIRNQQAEPITNIEIEIYEVSSETEPYNEQVNMELAEVEETAQNLSNTVAQNVPNLPLSEEQSDLQSQPLEDVSQIIAIPWPPSRVDDEERQIATTGGMRFGAIILE